jgi:hypothetical protein
MAHVIDVTSTSATLQLSLEELGLLINAIWQDLGYQQPRHNPIDDDTREAYDEISRQLSAAIRAIDAKT